MNYALKVLLTACIIVAASELSKKSALAGAILVSLPLTSVLTLAWRYTDSKQTSDVLQLSQGILLMVIPSLTFFVVLNLLLKRQLDFWPSLLVSCLGTAAVYALYVKVLRSFGVEL